MLPIDAVIAWVDGADPNHAAKVAHYSSEDTTVLPQSKSRFRFVGTSDEILFCIRSIRNHAPWIRKIWVITDNQHPPIDPRLGWLSNVRIVDHTAIFRGYEHLLPTFNSIAIETMMWRIPRLAPHFIYFNDDMGFCGPVTPEDFIRDGKMISRGLWSSYPDDQTGIWQNAQINAAIMAGSGRGHMFIDAHVPKILSRVVFEELFSKYREEFLANASRRFRAHDQFLPVGLHEHHCLKFGISAVCENRDWVHFTIKNCRSDTQMAIAPKVKLLASQKRKLYCINDYGALVKRFPEVKAHVLRGIGANQLFERAFAIRLAIRVLIGERNWSRLKAAKTKLPRFKRQATMSQDR